MSLSLAQQWTRVILHQRHLGGLPVLEPDVAKTLNAVTLHLTTLSLAGFGFLLMSHTELKHNFLWLRDEVARTQGEKLWLILIWEKVRCHFLEALDIRYNSWRAMIIFRDTVPIGTCPLITLKSYPTCYKRWNGAGNVHWDATACLVVGHVMGNKPFPGYHGPKWNLSLSARFIYFWKERRLKEKWRNWGCISDLL